jgi:hypothetical protein
VGNAGVDYRNNGRADRQESPYGRRKSSVHSSRVSKQMQNIDDKFNKYVKNINKSGSSGYIKPVFKQMEHQVNEEERGSRVIVRNVGEVNKYD